MDGCGGRERMRKGGRGAGGNGKLKGTDIREEKRKEVKSSPPAQLQ